MLQKFLLQLTKITHSSKFLVLPTHCAGSLFVQEDYKVVSQRYAALRVTIRSSQNQLAGAIACDLDHVT